MKPFPGITRVTIKKRDGYIFMINDPDVLISADNGNQFVCFGELKFDDPSQRMAQEQAQRLAAQQAARTAGAAGAAASGAAKEDKKADSNEPAESEDGITASHISMVQEHTNCTRNEAIRALRETNDDMINAVMKITGQ